METSSIQFDKCLVAVATVLANAENNEGVSADSLIVKNAIVDGGPMMKRYRPRARGMASPIQKKTSHITVILSDNA